MLSSLKSVNFIVVNSFISLFILSSIAVAQVPAGAALEAPAFGEVFSRMIPMFIFVFLIFYFMVIKPQNNKIKAQSTLIEGLNKGDKVVTAGGIIAKVCGKENDHVLLEIANNVRVKVSNSSIVKVYEPQS